MKGGVAFSSEDAFVDKMDLANGKQPLQLSELQYCNVLMKTECGAKTVRCLKDSGAQISLIQKDLIKDVDARVLGTVTIKGVIGQPAEAALVMLKIKPATSDDWRTLLRTLICVSQPVKSHEIFRQYYALQTWRSWKM